LILIWKIQRTIIEMPFKHLWNAAFFLLLYHSLAFRSMGRKWQFFIKTFWQTLFLSRDDPKREQKTALTLKVFVCVSRCSSESAFNLQNLNDFGDPSVFLIYFDFPFQKFNLSSQFMTDHSLSVSVCRILSYFIYFKLSKI